MNAPTIGYIIDIILNDARDPPSKVADAELLFIAGPLAGLKLIGFAVWEARIGPVRYVTVPAEPAYDNGDVHARAHLRPNDDYNPTAYDSIRALILAACRAAEAEASATTAEQLVRETLELTHRLTDEQAIELTEDITVVMNVEQLTPRRAWRFIVARVGGIHNVRRYLMALTSRHRAKQTQLGREPQRRFAARLYVGPKDAVHEIAELMRQAGIAVTNEGADHVHYTIQAPSYQAVALLTLAALRDVLPPSKTSAYSWLWIADRVYDVHPDDVRGEYYPPLRWHGL